MLGYLQWEVASPFCPAPDQPLFAPRWLAGAPHLQGRTADVAAVAAAADAALPAARRLSHWDGDAPADLLALEPQLESQRQRQRYQAADTGSGAARNPSGALHSRKISPGPASGFETSVFREDAVSEAVGGEPAEALSAQLPNMEAAAAKLLRETGVARLRPPMAPGESGEAGYRVIPFQVGSDNSMLARACAPAHIQTHAHAREHALLPKRAWCTCVCTQRHIVTCTRA